MIKKAIAFLLIFTVFVTTSCKKKEAADSKKGEFAKMNFAKRVHDFGSINDGDKVNVEFVFTNTSDTDLIITQAYGACGCTIPEYPKEPIKPGKKEKIKVSFDARGKSGIQNKTITIIANTVTGIENLAIKAVVRTKTTK